MQKVLREASSQKENDPVVVTLSILSLSIFVCASDRHFVCHSAAKRRNPLCGCRLFFVHNHFGANPTLVISTEAVHSLTVNRAVERSLYLLLLLLVQTPAATNAGHSERSEEPTYLLLSL
jgi:hypothetical protein